MTDLKNTPWKIEVDTDGTCDIYETDKSRESGLRWIAATIDEPTAKAIVALPDTLKRLDELEKAATDLTNAISDGSFMSIGDLSEKLKTVLEKWD